MSRPTRGTAFQRSISERIAALVGPHSVEVDSRSASAINSLLAARASARLLVELGEVGAPPAAERVPGGCEALPERLVGLPVDALDRLPLLDDRLEPVAVAFHCVESAAICSASAASASLRAICAGRAAAFSARDSAAAESAAVDHRPGPRGQAVEVADRRGGRDRLGEALRLVLDLAGVAGVRLQPRLEQRHLGGQVVVPAPVVGQPGGRLAGLPGADGALAVGGAHVDGAVLVDPAPLAGVADLGGGHLDGRRARAGAADAAAGAGRRAAGGGMRAGHGPGRLQRPRVLGGRLRAAGSGATRLGGGVSGSAARPCGRAGRVSASGGVPRPPGRRRRPAGLRSIRRRIGQFRIGGSGRGRRYRRPA